MAVLIAIELVISAEVEENIFSPLQAITLEPKVATPIAFSESADVTGTIWLMYLRCPFIPRRVA